MASLTRIHLTLFEYIPERGIIAYDGDKIRRDILENNPHSPERQNVLNILEDLGSNHGW